MQAIKWIVNPNDTLVKVKFDLVTIASVERCTPSNVELFRSCALPLSRGEL